MPCIHRQASYSPHDIRGAIIGVRSRCGGLYEISFKVIAQKAMRIPGKRGSSLLTGSVLIESLISKQRESLLYETILEGIREGFLTIEES